MTSSQHEENKFFIKVEKFKNLGMISTNQNCMHREIKGRLNFVFPYATYKWKD